MVIPASLIFHAEALTGCFYNLLAYCGLHHVQAPAIAAMGTEIAWHNELLLQLAQQFPANHPGAPVHTYDFGAAFSQARVLLKAIHEQNVEVDLALALRLRWIARRT